MTPFESDGATFANVFLKAMEAVRDMPLADRLAMASVLTVMAGAPIIEPTDAIAAKAATVVPLFAEILKRTAKGTDTSAEVVDTLFHDLYNDPVVSKKFMTNIYGALLLYATTTPHGA